jgi:hypothetical protein
LAQGFCLLAHVRICTAAPCTCVLAGLLRGAHRNKTPVPWLLAPCCLADPYCKFLMIKRDPPRSFREALADLSSKGLAGLSRRSAAGSKSGAAGAAPWALPAGASSRIIEASSVPAAYSLAKHSGGSAGALQATPEDAQLEGAESGKLPSEKAPPKDDSSAATAAAGDSSNDAADGSAAGMQLDPQAAAPRSAARRVKGCALGWWALAVVACNPPDPATAAKGAQQPPAKGLGATAKRWGNVSWYYFVT